MLSRNILIYAVDQQIHTGKIHVCLSYYLRLTCFCHCCNNHQGTFIRILKKYKLPYYITAFNTFSQYIITFMTTGFKLFSSSSIVLQPEVGLGLDYNTSPSLSIPCSISPFVYSHLSQVCRHIIQPSHF
jgi:hypothetical protein